jgi:hypothetical protein
VRLGGFARADYGLPSFQVVLPIIVRAEGPLPLLEGPGLTCVSLHSRSRSRPIQGV